MATHVAQKILWRGTERDFEAVRVLHRRGHRLPVHNHRYPGFVLSLRGSFDAWIEGTHFRVQAGQALVVPSFLRHSEAVGARGSDAVVATMRSSWQGPRGTLVLPRLFEGVTFERLARCLRLEFKGHAGDLPQPERVRERLLDTGEAMTRCHPLQPQRQGRPLWLETARQMLDESDQRLELRELAAATGIDRSHLARTWKNVYGVSVGVYGRLRRLEKACTDLERSNDPIAEIARRYGFADGAHLAHRLQDAYGATASCFRNASRNFRGAPSDASSAP